MELNKGLNLDMNPRDVTTGEWKDARNILLSKGFQSIENEGGFDPNGILFGTIDNPEDIKGWVLTPDCAIIFTHIAIDGNYISKIYKYIYDAPTATIVKTFIVSTSTYNPNTHIVFNNSITGVFTHNYKNELIVVWCDGIEDTSNQIYSINIDAPAEHNHDYYFNPDAYNISIDVSQNYDDRSSELKSGVYYFTIAGELNDGSITTYSTVTPGVMLLSKKGSVAAGDDYTVLDILESAKIDDVVKGSFIVTVNRTIEPYLKYRLGVIYDNGVTKEFYYNPIAYTIEQNKQESIRFNTLKGFIKDDLYTPLSSISPYIKADSLAINTKDNASELLLGGVSYDNDMLGWEAGQHIANGIKLSYTTTFIMHMPHGYRSNIIPVFQQDEIYAFYMGIRNRKGNVIGIWHIPSYATYDAVENDWLDKHENTEVYDDNFPDYAGRNIAHFKIPDVRTELAEHRYVYKIIAHLPELPAEIRKEDVFILHARRDFTNNRIIGTDVLHKSTWIKSVYLLPEPMGDLRGHCFDLMLTKPSLSNINKIKVTHKFTCSVKSDESAAKINHNNVKAVHTHEDRVNDGILYNADILKYVPSNNAAVKNGLGESHIAVNGTSGSNVLCMKYGIDPHLKLVVQYLNDSNSYYADIYNQELVQCSKYTNGEIECRGDAYPTMYYFRMTIARKPAFETANVDMAEDGKTEHSAKAWFATYTIGMIPAIIRLEGNAPFEKVFPLTSDEGIYYDGTKDNYIDSPTGLGYNMAYAGKNTFYQGISKYKDESENIKKQYNLIARSDVYRSESKDLSWRNFRINSYYSIPGTMGRIISLLSDGFTLYIQLLHELFIASVRDTISSDEGDIRMGSGDIFDRPPKPIMHSTAGHISCMDKKHCALTPFGYTVVDKINNRIMLVAEGNPVEISALQTETYFLPTISTVPKNEIKIGFDYINKRLLYHFGGSFKESVSYNTGLLKWVSFHDYNISDALSIGNHVMYFKNNILTNYTPNANYGKYGDYIYNKYVTPFKSLTNHIKQSYVDVYYTDAIMTAKILQSLAWKTITIQNKVDTFEDTIDAIMIYNDTQCTGILRINKNKEFYNSETGLLINGMWYYNKIDDAVLNNRLPFLDENRMPTANVNISQKDWFTQSKFICDWAISRLIIDNIRQRKIIVNSVNFIAQRDAR